MKKYLVVVLSFISLSSLKAFADAKHWGHRRGDQKLGSGLILAEKVSKPSKELLAMFAAGKYNFYTVDLDQDGKLDFIAENLKDEETCFIKSDFKIKSCEPINYSKGYGFNYEFFIPNGKNNPMILLDLSGDEDSSEFSLKEFDDKTWKIKTVTSVLPLIDSKDQAHKGVFWGYPWDITGLKTKVEAGEVKVLALFDHQIDTDDSGSPSPGPAILFEGTATQGEKTGPHNKLKSKMTYMSFTEIKKQVALKAAVKK